MDARTLGIVWEDGHESIFDTTTLRENCGCAACVDEWSGEKKIKPGQLPATVTPINIDSVGHYGLTVQWSDGHKTGIYSFEVLRKLCQCAVCKKS